MPCFAEELEDDGPVLRRKLINESHKCIRIEAEGTV